MACRAGIIALFFISFLAADPYLPWTGIDKLPYLTVYGGYGHAGHLPQPSAHNFGFEGVDLSIALDRDLEVGFNLEVAETDRRSFLYNGFECYFSKLLMNDLTGDPLSVMLSLKMGNVGGSALREPALVHFGEWEWRAILSAGKEWTRCYDWWFRLSGYLSVGIANRGTPWLEEGFSLEQKFSATCHYLVGLRGIQAFGGHHIGNTPFRQGWGPYSFDALSFIGGFSETICDVEAGIWVESTFWTSHFYSNITKVWLEFRLPLAF